MIVGCRTLELFLELLFLLLYILYKIALPFPYRSSVQITFKSESASTIAIIKVRRSACQSGSLSVFACMSLYLLLLLLLYYTVLQENITRLANYRRISLQESVSPVDETIPSFLALVRLPLSSMQLTLFVLTFYAPVCRFA